MNSSATVASVRRAEDLLLAGAVSEARHAAAELAAAPGTQAEGLYVLGLVEAQAREFDRAAEYLEMAVRRNSSRPSWWTSLGRVQDIRGKWSDSVAAYSRALELQPDNASAWRANAEALQNCGRWGDALRAWQRASDLGCDFLTCALAVSSIYLTLGEFEEAVDLLRTAAGEYPDDARAYSLLARAHELHHRPAEALRYRELAWQLRPDDPVVTSALAARVWDSGEVGRGLELVRQAISVDQPDRGFHSFYLSALLHHPDETAASLRAAHEHWAATHCASVQPHRSWPNSADPARRLRVGWMGGDFYDNPAFHFVVPFFLYADKSNVELHVYDIHGRHDACNAVFRAHADLYRDCSRMKESELAELIRANEVDILIDTTGHYWGSCLVAYAWHPAPVQLAFPSYPSTTGISQFDAIITDHWVCPPGHESQYTEPVVRLPSGYLPWHPPEVAPPLSDPPVLRNGFITFGLFQRPVKISPAAWDAIAEVLHRVPDSRLLVHNAYRELDDAGSPMRVVYAQELGRRGVAPERVSYIGSRPLAEHLRILATADIALDTFPYNGQTTTCECLWMGVPVVTLTGGHHVARVGRCILQRAGFGDWEAHTPQQYIDTAVQLAENPARLGETRASMRRRIEASSLVGPTAARELEAAIRTLWTNWCQKEHRNQ